MTSRIRTEDAGWDNADIPLRTLQRAGLVTQNGQGDVRLRTSGWQALILLAELASRQEVLPEDEQTVENVWEVVREAHLNRQAAATVEWVRRPWSDTFHAQRTRNGDSAITSCGLVIRHPAASARKDAASWARRCLRCEQIVGES